ncbi:MAG: dihydropteroate synthase [Dehalogenimonas sp.]|uniref:Dihydropteroate synthase n=1 Tax=Candidatus Dehalogenimonas loeffleri TaxID=3127115 RepID=A0ABZ2J845_9CHLR|nr:dihydropteroate synthase [Dehalogenimonas sp.]
MTILIAENINVMSKSLGQALKERQSEPVQSITGIAARAGIDYLDLNIGPAKKTGADLMSWLVSTVQEVTDLPLSLDTTNAAAIEAGLKASKRRALVNSVSMQPERLEQLLPVVSKYGAEMIGLLWGAEGMPRDVNERCLLTVDLVYRANEAGIINEDIWIDPIATPVSGEINQLNACVEFLTMLPEIAPGCKSVVGLSNVSNGSPARLRPILNRTYFIMLARYGLHAAIIDALDEELIAIARGLRPDIVNTVHRTMDGDMADPAIIGKHLADYVKTVRVLTGQTLYSDSWLEI